MPKSMHTYRRYLWISALIVLAVEAFVVLHFVQQRSEQHAHFRQVGNSTAAAIPVSLIQKINTDTVSIHSTSFTEMNQLLHAIVQQNPIGKYAYLLGKKDGNLYFIADSEALDSEDFSPPGQIYAEATALDFELFETGSQTLVEHSSDRWGDWVSVLVPIRSTQSGEVLAVFGIDYAAEAWSRHWLIDLLISGAIALLMLMVLFFFGQLTRKSGLLAGELLEKERLSEELLTSQSLYHSFVEQLPSPVYRKNLLGQFVMINEAFCDFFQSDRAKILGKTLAQAQEAGLIIGEFDLDSHDKIIQSKSVTRTEESFFDNNRHLVHMLSIRMPVWNSNHQLSGTQGILTNISSLVETRAMLVESRKKAEESDRLKSAFLANLNHEMRTPLNSIFGFSELLSEESLSLDDRKKYIQLIRKSSERMFHTINDILELSMLQTGQRKPILETVSLDGLLKVLRLKWQARMKEKNLNFFMDEYDTGLLMITDFNMLNSILNHLLDNAWKFTEKGFVRLSCLLESGNLTFVVEDSGIGIDANNMKKIFYYFRQADAGFARKYDGNGLGLPLCRAYAQLLSGDVWVESQASRGSRFFCRISSATNKDS